MLRYIAALTTLLALVALPSSAQAQLTTGNQIYTVTVLSTMSIVAPAPAVLVHDTSDNDQVFPVQNWIAHTTGLVGANVTLVAQTPFINALDGDFQRDAKLDLAITSSDSTAGWAVTVDSDQTDYLSESNTATVSAASSGPGLGQLGLTVTFVETGYSSLAAGAYLMTVAGTIASN